MTDEQKRNIGRGVREAVRHKRLSKSMKLSWRRRRELRLHAAKLQGDRRNSVLEMSKLNPTKVKVGVRPDELFEMALRVLGYTTVCRVLKGAITDKLNSL
jgi:hypothetical protein